MPAYRGVTGMAVREEFLVSGREEIGVVGSSNSQWEKWTRIIAILKTTEHHAPGVTGGRAEFKAAESARTEGGTCKNLSGKSYF